MPRTLPPRAIAFHEVRHFQPDDCLHYEPISVRGRLHQWTIPPHRHETLHQFQLLERGAARASLDGTVVELRAPTLLVVAAGTVHGFHYAPDSAGHQVTVPTAELRAALADAPALREQLARSFVLDSAALVAPAREEAASTQATDASQWMLQLAREFEKHALFDPQELTIGRRTDGRGAGAVAEHSHLAKDLAGSEGGQMQKLFAGRPPHADLTLEHAGQAFQLQQKCSQAIPYFQKALDLNKDLALASKGLEDCGAIAKGSAQAQPAATDVNIAPIATATIVSVVAP